MAKFVQIGHQAFNPEHITDIHIGSTILVYLLGIDEDGKPNRLDFDSVRRNEFMEWWETYADVHKFRKTEESA